MDPMLPFPNFNLLSVPDKLFHNLIHIVDTSTVETHSSTGDDVEDV